MTEAKVLQIIDRFTVVIDKGEIDNVSVGTDFDLLQIIDPSPINQKYLGTGEQGIENPVGKGTVKHVQEKISILTSLEMEEPYTEQIESSESPMSPLFNRKTKTIKHENKQKPFAITDDMIGALIARKI